MHGNAIFESFDSPQVIVITKRRLRHLMAIVTHAHFGRAAAALNISQPALTKSIQALESDLGVTLLDRKRGAVTLTVFGELVVRRSTSLLNMEADLRRELALLSGHEIGSVTVALAPYPSMLSGYAAIARLCARHPRLHLTARVGGWRDVANKVATREVDLGIAELSPFQESDQFVTELVGQHRGRFFCRPGHPIHQRGIFLPARLFEYPWVACRIPLRIAGSLPRELGAAGSIDPVNGDFVPAIELDVPANLAQFLEGSDALALATLTMMEEQLRDGVVEVLPTKEPDIRTEYGFLHLKDRTLSPATLTLMQEVRDVEAELKKREAALADQLIDT